MKPRQAELKKQPHCFTLNACTYLKSGATPFAFEQNGPISDYATEDKKYRRREYLQTKNEQDANAHT